MLIAQIPEAYNNLPDDQKGDESQLLFWILTEVGVFLLVVLILYFVIVKPQKDRRRKELEERAKK